MRKIQNYQLELHDQKQWILIGNQVATPIQAGTGDELEVFQNGKQTLVLAQNKDIPYVGLESLDGQIDLFFQEAQVEAVLGKDWEDKNPYWKTRVLLNFA